MSIKYTPGPWTVGYRAMSVVCENAKIGGEAKLFDVRAWGYLTGHGHGGLGLDEETAYGIQMANAQLVAAAPDLLAALQAVMAEWQDGYGLKCADQCRAAIAKTEPTR